MGIKVEERLRPSHRCWNTGRLEPHRLRIKLYITLHVVAAGAADLQGTLGRGLEAEAFQASAFKIPFTL